MDSINDQDPIITIKTKGSDLQTKFSTIKDCQALLNLLNMDNKTIIIDKSYDEVDNLLNYLRGNYNEHFLARNAHNFRQLGIEIIKDDYVFINIGGKILYLCKTYLENKFGYFEKFFENYTKFHPDYSAIMIDRSPKLFERILNLIKIDNLGNNSTKYKNESEFYLFKSNKYFLDMTCDSFHEKERYNIREMKREIKSIHSSTCQYFHSYRYPKDVYLISDNLTPENIKTINIKCNCSDNFSVNCEVRIKACKFPGIYFVKPKRKHSKSEKNLGFTLTFPKELISTKILECYSDKGYDFIFADKKSIQETLDLTTIKNNYIEIHLKEIINKHNINTNNDFYAYNLNINTNIKKKYLSHVELINNNNIFCRTSIEKNYLSDENTNYKFENINKYCFGLNTKLKIYLFNTNHDDELILRLKCGELRKIKKSINLRYF
ncbi:BTB/POZ domain protein [Cotonvirus japonicus]|uniref:BTB/POZ domain protein n=1 Tax=Cotonvirus japonicus TaxID=2811091 RepID=A0ABM7NTY9_9VIRU|nr:BTB/POZ domain protein [Cotonvirus japonicus]BCS83642.1 BTB/POZ domain protein [Cotonvirus japonicus]